MSVLSTRVSGELIDDGRPVVVKSPVSFWMRVMGLPFAMAGVGMIVAYHQADERMPVAMPLVGVLFAIAGLGLLLHVSRCVIDPLRGAIEVTRGVIVPLWRRSLPFDQIDRVALFSYRASSGNGSNRIQYGVVAVPVGEQVEWPDPIRRGCWIYSSGSYSAARQWAERVCLLVRKPLEDRIDGISSVRSPDELNTPIAEIWRREGTPQTLDPPPADGRLKHEQRGDEIRVELPAGGLRGPAVILAVVLAAEVSSLGFFALFLFMTDLPLAGKLMFAGFLVLPIVIVAALLAWCVRGRTWLEAGPQGVTIVRRLGPRTRRVHFGAGALEEVIPLQGRPAGSLLRQMMGGCLVLRSDQQRETVGWGLSQDELQWLVSAIRWGLTHRG